MAYQKSFEANGPKWINLMLLAIAAAFWYYSRLLLVQVGVWFELESKLPSYPNLMQAAAILIGIVAFFVVKKNQFLMDFFSKSYSELGKSVFPERNDAFKSSLQVMLFVTMIGVILSVFDFTAGFLFNYMAKL